MKPKLDNFRGPEKTKGPVLKKYIFQAAHASTKAYHLIPCTFSQFYLESLSL
jgi:hypothetical protein